VVGRLGFAVAGRTKASVPTRGVPWAGLQQRHGLQSLQPSGGLVPLKVMIFRLLVRTKGLLFRDGKPGTLKSGRLYV
jgi:hypothetical protein